MRDRDASARYLLLLLGGIGYFCLMFVWFSLPATLVPVMEELELSNTQGGILAGAVPAVYIPLALVTGLVADRIGSRRTLTAALAIIGTAQLLRATAETFPAMLLWTLLLGVGATGITFGLPKLVAELFEPERAGTMSSVYLVWSYVGTATAFGIGRPFLQPFLGGWRALFLVTGAVVVGYAVLWGAFGALTRRRGLATPLGTGDPPAFTPGSIREDVTAVVAHKEMRLLVVVGSMYLFLLHGLQGWLVTLLEVRGVPPETAGIVASLLVVGQIIGVLGVPPLAERFDRRKEAVVACGVVVAIASAALVGTVGLWAILPVALVGLAAGGLSPLVRALPVELAGIGPRLAATAVGLVFAVGEIGGFLGPVLVGVLRDATGTFTAGLALFAVCGLVIVAAGVAMDIDGREA